MYLPACILVEPPLDFGLALFKPCAVRIGHALKAYKGGVVKPEFLAYFVQHVYNAALSHEFFAVLFGEAVVEKLHLTR